MTRPANIWEISRIRILQHREETRNVVRDAITAIKISEPPISTDVVERPFMIPLGHDPYDIWHLILHSITDPLEIMKLSEVCPMFREILRCKRKCIQARLPQIAQLILDKRPRYLLEPKDLDAHWRYRVPRRYVSPSNQIPLNLRLISRGSKNSAEALLETMDSRRLYVKIKAKEWAYSIIDAIMGKEIMADSFFPPNLEVTLPTALNPMHEFNRFSEAIGVLLELTGERIRTFIVSYVATENPRRFYDKLVEWVLYLPNLESLELFRRGYLITREDGDIQHLPAFPPCLQRLQLRSLTIFYPRLLGPVVQRIIESSPFLKTLDVQHAGMEDLIPTPEMIPMLPHLESLHVPLYPSLQQNLQFPLPLKKIVLHRHYSCRETTSTNLFPFLNMFKDALEHLELGLEVQKTGHCEFLDLPNLIFFKWRYNESFKNMQFLLHAERLEVVHMTILQRIDDADDFLERFLVRAAIGFEDVDIWKVFPRMRKFRTCWRGEYKKICRP